MARQAALDARKGSEEIIEPADVAETYYHLHRQPRGIWTLDPHPPPPLAIPSPQEQYCFWGPTKYLPP